MQFITAILLMYMPEEEAFWTLVALLKGGNAHQTNQHAPLEGMFQPGMPLLQQCLFQFQQLIQYHLPKLAAHLHKVCTCSLRAMDTTAMYLRDAMRSWRELGQCHH